MKKITGCSRLLFSSLITILFIHLAVFQSVSHAQTENGVEIIFPFPSSYIVGYGYLDEWPLCANGLTTLHPAEDLADSGGDWNIRAIADGDVTFVHRDDTGFGYHLEIEHTLADGTHIYSHYAHFSEIYVTDPVSVPDPVTVNKGDIIGRMGQTGNATGNHLHFEIRTQQLIPHEWPDCFANIDDNRDTLIDWIQGGVIPRYSSPTGFVVFSEITDGAMLFEHSYYRGSSFKFLTSGSYNLSELGLDNSGFFNDIASSTAIPREWVIKVYKNEIGNNDHDEELTITENDLNFDNDQFDDGTPLNDNISAIEVIAAKLDVALIIDTTGSMRSNDKNNMRKQAARVFINAAQLGDKIAVVGFDTVASHYASLTTILSQTERDMLLSSVNQVDSYGNTNLNVGLNGGFSELSSDTRDVVKAAVFLTDGEQHTYPPSSYNPQSHLQYQQEGWPIYTIGLGNDADVALLEQIASETGGQFFALTDPNQLQSVYFKISQHIAGGSIVLDTSLPITQGSNHQLFADVPLGSSSVTFFTTWPGSEVSMSLISPSGRHITSSTIDADVYHAKDLTYEMYSIQHPEPGEWTIDLFGTDLSEDGELVEVQVSVLGIKNVYLPIVLKDYDSSSPPEPPPFDCASVPFGGISLFEDKYCHGDYEPFPSPGLFNLSSLDNQITSIHIPSGFSAKVYEDVNGGGQSRCLKWDYWDLTVDRWPDDSIMDNTISSVEVFENYNCDPPPQPFNCDSVPYAGILLFEDHYCSGEYRQFLAPDFFNLTDLEFNDRISSIHVPSGTSVMVHEHVDRTGENLCVPWDKWDLAIDVWPNGSSMNDTISSVEIFDNGNCDP